MRSLILLLAAATLTLPAAAFAQCSQGTVDLAQGIVSHTERQFDSGAATSSDVIIAKMALQDALVCSGQLSKANFCKAKGELLSDLQKINTRDVGVGYGPTGMGAWGIGYLKERIAFEKQCN